MSQRDENECFTDAELPTGDDRRLAAAPALRQRAEAALRLKAAQSLNALEALAPEGNRQALHELRVHHIELEMQNEELRRAQVELDAARARYFDLYDLAPIGYCTLGENGLIIEANLTAASLLGVPRGALVRQAFSRFIVKADEDIYYPVSYTHLDVYKRQKHYFFTFVIFFDGFKNLFFGICLLYTSRCV